MTREEAQLELLRLYLDPAEIGGDGYPYAWHGTRMRYEANGPPPVWEKSIAIKDLIRELGGHRCQRCGHPYRKGEHGSGEWSPCDERCTHMGSVRICEAGSADYLGPDSNDPEGGEAWGPLWVEHNLTPQGMTAANARLDYGPPDGREMVRWDVEAQWRILTVHHLNGIKYDCRWWNLTSLCQRCHLTIQAKVYMERPWNKPHTEWFKPHAAGFYASSILGEELTREQTMERLDELLALQQTQDALF